MARVVVSDPVMLYLVACNLTDFEAMYRGLLQIAGAEDEPSARHFTIATSALMLTRAGVPMPAVMAAVNTLSHQSDEDLKDGLIAILNGTHLIISQGQKDHLMMLIDTLKVCTEEPKYVLTSSIYFVKGAWQQADDILAGRA